MLRTMEEQNLRMMTSRDFWSPHIFSVIQSTFPWGEEGSSESREQRAESIVQRAESRDNIPSTNLVLQEMTAWLMVRFW